MDREDPVIARLKTLLKPVGPWSASALSLKAGLARSHIGGILREEQSANLERDTAVKIARAADVRVEWLMTGEEPRAPFVDPDMLRMPFKAPAILGGRRSGEPLEQEHDPYPARAQYFHIARKRRADESILSALREETPKGAQGDPTDVEYWHKRYLFLKRIADRVENDLRPVTEFDEDEAGEPSKP